MVVEVLGTPRSGKTENIHKFASMAPSVCIYEERFDLNPYPQSDLFNYNFWYAQYVAQKIDIFKGNDNCVFDRGIIDRIVFGKALREYGIFSVSQYQQYTNLLVPHIAKVNYGLVVVIDPQMSLTQIKSSKSNITRDMKFLEVLNKYYLWASQAFPNFYLVDPAKISDNLEKLIL